MKPTVYQSRWCRSNIKLVGLSLTNLQTSLYAECNRMDIGVTWTPQKLSELSGLQINSVSFQTLGQRPESALCWLGLLNLGRVENRKVCSL